MPWTVPARTTALAAGLMLAGSACQTLAQTPPNPQNPPQQQAAQTGKLALPPRADAAPPTTQPGSNPHARTLTLQEAVTVALQNSKNLRIAAEGVERARGRVAEQRTGTNPSLNAVGTFTHLDEGSSFTIPDANGNPQTIPIVRQNQKALNIQGNLPLDIFGLIRAAVQQAQFSEIASRLDFNRTRNQVVMDVKNAYYDVLRSKAFVTVQQQALVNAQDRQKIAEANLRAGTGTRFDVLRAQTDVANAEQNLISARNRVNLSVATLNNVLNIDQNTPVDVTEATEPGPIVEGFDQAVSEAYQKRPEIFQAEANVRAAEKGVKVAERSSTPSLGVGANFGYTPDVGGFAPKTSSWAAVATVTVPLFDQGLSRARRQQARADVETAKTNKQITQDTVALEVRQAYLGMTEAQDRLNVTSTALTQAQEQYRLAQVRFQAGVTSVPGGSPLLEISDAQAALTQAQTNNVNAQYDLQNSKARLDRAIGRYAYDGTTGKDNPGLPGPNRAAAETGAAQPFRVADADAKKSGEKTANKSGDKTGNTTATGGTTR